MNLGIPKIFYQQNTDEEVGGDGGSMLTGPGKKEGEAPPPAETVTPKEDLELPEWKKALPDDLRVDPSLRAIHDVNSLTKSYIAAQKMVGKDKIAIPDEHATDDDIRAVYTKLGLPDKAEEYDFKYDKEAFGDDEIKDIKGMLHKAGVTNTQAGKILEGYHELLHGNIVQVEEAAEQDRNQALEQLKTEWGGAYNQKLQGAQSLIQEICTEDEVKYLDESGLGNDPRLVKLFSDVHDKFMAEDQVKGRGDESHRRTPNEAQDQIDAMFGDRDNAFHKADHPNHAKAVQKMEQLFKETTAAAEQSP